MVQGNSKVVVHVQLDAAYYYAGDTVTGAVVLHMEQPIAVKAVEAKVSRNACISAYSGCNPSIQACSQCVMAERASDQHSRLSACQHLQLFPFEVSVLHTTVYSHLTPLVHSLNIISTYFPVKCHQITGVEKTKWVERRNSGNTSHDETYHGKHVIFKV
jgi:hypothetical protein